MIPAFEVSENVVVYAFRYALGRRTGAVNEVVEMLLKVWPRLDALTRQQIASEILTAMKRDDAGWAYEIKLWQRVLDTHFGLCPDCLMSATHCLCSHDS